MGIDQPGHQIPAVEIDHPCIRRDAPARCNTVDLPVPHDECGALDRGTARPVDDNGVCDDQIPIPALGRSN